MPERIAVLKHWLQSKNTSNDLQMTAMQNDASLRTFYRVHTDPATVLMDAARDTKNREYLHAAELLKKYGLCVPEIFAHDMEQGLFHMEDFGDGLFFNKTSQPGAESFLEKAVDAIILIQQIPTAEVQSPVCFDGEFILRELNLFSEWFVEKYLELELNSGQEKTLNTTLASVIKIILDHPHCCMHRDFHSRNLMILPDDRIGILDFQDLMIGPVTYDLVSLLKDCYVTYDSGLVERMLRYFFQKQSSGFRTFAELQFHFDITGLQRHLKVLGGFSKIYLERGNGFYLQYFDRILDYVIQVTAKYPRFEQFYLLLISVIIPKLLRV